MRGFRSRCWLLLAVLAVGIASAQAALDWSVYASHTSFGEFDSSHAGNERRCNYTIFNQSAAGDVNSLIQWIVPAGSNQGVYKALCDSNPDVWTASIGANQTTFTGVIVPGGDELFKIFTSLPTLGQADAQAMADGGSGGHVPFPPQAVVVPVSVGPPWPVPVLGAVGFRLTDVVTVTYKTNVVYTTNLVGLPTAGLVALYPLDGAGVNAYGCASNGAMLGPITSTNRFGVTSGACSFDGVNDYFDIPHNACVDGLMNQLTLCAWVRPDEETDQAILAKAVSGHPYPSDQFILILRADGHLAYESNGSGSWYVGASVLQPGTWYHIAASTVINSQHRLFVNGVEEANSPFAIWMGMDGNTANVRIGHSERHGTNLFFHGAMDDVLIYNRALPPTEIQQIAASVGCVVSVSTNVVATTNVLPAGVTLTCTNVGAGLNYTVERSETLGGTNWMGVGSLSVSPAPAPYLTSAEWSEAVTNVTTGFYRIKLTPP